MIKKFKDVNLTKSATLAIIGGIEKDIECHKSGIHEMEKIKEELNHYVIVDAVHVGGGGWTMKIVHVLEKERALAAAAGCGGRVQEIDQMLAYYQGRANRLEEMERKYGPLKLLSDIFMSVLRKIDGGYSGWVMLEDLNWYGERIETAIKNHPDVYLHSCTAMAANLTQTEI